MNEAITEAAIAYVAAVEGAEGYGTDTEELARRWDALTAAVHAHETLFLPDAPLPDMVEREVAWDDDFAPQLRAMYDPERMRR